MNVLSVIGRAIVAFAATNIDDIFVLTLFFAQKHLKHWHIVAGQYLGLAGLKWGRVCSGTSRQLTLY